MSLLFLGQQLYAFITHIYKLSLTFHGGSFHKIGHSEDYIEHFMCIVTNTGCQNSSAVVHNVSSYARES